MFEQLRGNARLRAGIALAIVLVLVTLLLDAQAAIDDRRRAVAREQARLQSMSRDVDGPLWLQRAAAARQLREQVQAALWQAGSAGAAEAAFVDWINRELAQANITNANVVSASVPAGPLGGAARPAAGLPEGHLLMRVNAGFAHSPGVLERVLERLLAGERMVTVESVSVRQRPVPRVELVIASVARIGAAPASGR
jgi:hypothetical protein